MNLFFRKRMVLAAGAVSIMALCAMYPLAVIAGTGGLGGVARGEMVWDSPTTLPKFFENWSAPAGGGGGEASLLYDPFAGDVTGEVQFSLPDIDEISLTAAAAIAEPSSLSRLTHWLDWFKRRFQIILDSQLGLPWLGISDAGVETGKTKLIINEKQRYLIIQYADMLLDKSLTVSQATNYIYLASQIKGATKTDIRNALIEEANNMEIKLTEHQLND